MIGFTTKKLSFCGLVAALLSVLLSACVQPPVVEQRQPPAEAADAEPSADQPRSVAGSGQAEKEELTAPLLYGVLLGEIAG